MGRAILPEVILAVLVLGIAGVVLVGIGVAQWVAGAAMVTRIKQGRRRRALERELAARRAARWESRTRYQRGYAVVDVVPRTWTHLVAIAAGAWLRRGMRLGSSHAEN